LSIFSTISLADWEKADIEISVKSKTAWASILAFMDGHIQYFTAGLLREKRQKIQ
jgi:hypothetical protein